MIREKRCAKKCDRQHNAMHNETTIRNYHAKIIMGV